MNAFDATYPYRFKTLLADIKARGVSVPPGAQSVFYSGPERGHNLPPHAVTNRRRAEQFAEREGAANLERTPRGAGLEEGRETLTGQMLEEMNKKFAIHLMTREWLATSRDFAQQANGHVKVFCAGAARAQVFRSVELPALVDNANVQTINGLNRTDLSRIYHRGPSGRDRAYRLIALAGIRQDMQQAMRTGNRALIKDAITQQILYRDQKTLDADPGYVISPAAQTANAAEIDRRTEKLIGKAQAQAVTDLALNLSAYTGHRIAKGLMMPELAAQLHARGLAAAATDPDKTFRINALLRIKVARDAAVAHINPAAIHRFLDSREQYQADTRATRQAEGKDFVPNQPVLRELRRGNLAKHSRDMRAIQQNQRRSRTGNGRDQSAHGRTQARRVKPAAAKPARLSTHIRLS